MFGLTERIFRFSPHRVPRLRVLSVLAAAFCGSLFPSTVAISAEPQADWVTTASGFFHKHCVACHAAAAPEAGLSLEQPNFTLASRAQTDLWTRIFDRVARGEMPPAGTDRPTQAEMESFLAAARPALTGADRAQREVVQRRLNRIEYQNTIRDLLAIDLNLIDYLPEDQQAGGFDNIGEALAISSEQMQGYLAAARHALDEAIVTGPRPATETFTVDSVRETKPYFGQGSYDYVDGRVVLHISSDGISYSKVSTRDKRVRTRGRYRFRFQAAAHDAPSTLCFAVTAAVFQSQGITQRTLGYFEVGAEPRTFELEATMEANGALQFFALGLPTYLRSKPGVTYPGVGFGEVEITGPLYDQWPPECHSRLFGDLDLKTGTLADARQILQRFIPRAFRRAATDDEVAPYVELVAARLAAGRSFTDSIRVGLMGVLCSPHFLYLNEDRRDPTERVSAGELASRLSYFLWSAPPDEELLRLAGERRLNSSDALRAQTERMLQDPKSEAFVKNFTGQWLRLRQINETEPDSRLYPKFDELLQESMTWESEGYFREMLRADISIDDFLSSNWAMLNERLARHYEINGITGLNLRKVALPAGSVRGGVLTQAAILKVTANGTNTSPVTRGVWVLENILGRPTPPPPPNTAGIEPDIRGATTIREQLALHRGAESCNVCHRSIDPPGFALESFDPIGAYRESYVRWQTTNPEMRWGKVVQGANVDPAGETESGETFADVRDFKRLLLARRSDFAACLAEKLLCYATGRELGFSDRDAVANVVRQTQAGGNGLRTLIHAVVQSETFATR